MSKYCVNYQSRFTENLVIELDLPHSIPNLSFYNEKIRFSKLKKTKSKAVFPVI